ncbi:SGNH/GDSL hydrolase family protein [Aquabacterium sp. OR-4]|uniref:SGNH/GDSL hydrolase family protein n=1 Tax=Aquabacterium sp. OR-4 TaxID=2978127 RepID=UPI0028C8B714|nr:SGNH/GDSL hydrolase family protein [Aquabacterium sp. OR-4]MDT7834606.1 SGNH/GDSL hydrolase family protein [Aquabacterium sp. OR-4]
MPHRFQARSVAAAVLLCLAAATPSVHAFSGLVVVGDSLSDDGNLYALTGGTFPPPPYYQGRFADGPVAVEHLAAGLGTTGAAFTNLAIAGARTGADGNGGAGTGMLSQLAGFQASLGGGAADSGALYFVWGGANDLRGGVSIDTAVANLKSIVSSLHDLGAREFLLPNLPDLGLTPEGRASGAVGAAMATDASELFNSKLATAYAELALSWSDETFYFFDAMSAQRAITDGSPLNGFTNVTQSCISLGAGCTPASFLYWDGIHPTTAAHQILGAQMLAAVPEPATVLTMALGVLALLGHAARRRRQA